MRGCPFTEAWLPRYFLQDFEQVRHPDTGAACWAPGPLSFAGPAGDEGPRRTRSPITGYALSRKALVDAIGARGRAGLMMIRRTGMAVTPDTRQATWRGDMGDVLLRMLRRHAVDALVASAAAAQPCAGWEAVGGVLAGSCVLWLPRTGAGRRQAAQYATLDVAGARYDAKRAVHDLAWLLGADEAARLRRTAPFGEHEVLVLRQGEGAARMLQLRLALWRLQGFLGGGGGGGQQ